jgi:hypothetical protein
MREPIVSILIRPDLPSDIYLEEILRISTEGGKRNPLTYVTGKIFRRVFSRRREGVNQAVYETRKILGGALLNNLGLQTAHEVLFNSGENILIKPIENGYEVFDVPYTAVQEDGTLMHTRHKVVLKKGQPVRVVIHERPSGVRLEKTSKYAGKPESIIV